MILTNRAELVALAKTMTTAQLAEHYGIPRTTMRSRLVAAGIEPVKGSTNGGGKFKVLPDLESLCKTMNKAQLARHYGVKDKTVAQHLERHGLTAITGRTVSLAKELDGIHELAKTMHASALARHYGVGKSMISRRLAKLGIEAVTLSKSEPIIKADDDRYTDIAVLCRQMHAAALARHYGVAEGTMSKVLAKRQLVAIPAPIRQPVQRKSRHVQQTGFKVPSATDYRSKTQADLAADFLRRECPIIKCDERGKFSLRGTFYRRASRILASDELIALALRKGWERWAA